MFATLKSSSITLAWACCERRGLLVSRRMIDEEWDKKAVQYCAGVVIRRLGGTYKRALEASQSASIRARMRPASVEPSSLAR